MTPRDAVLLFMVGTAVLITGTIAVVFALVLLL